MSEQSITYNNYPLVCDFCNTFEYLDARPIFSIVLNDITHGEPPKHSRRMSICVHCLATSDIHATLVFHNRGIL